MIKRFFSGGKKFSDHQIKITHFLKTNLGITTRRLELYELALTHKSYYRKPDTKLKNNERLEYLGDAIIGAVVADELYKKFPDESEGELTRIRSRIVCREGLNNLGDEIELEPLILYRKSGNDFLSLLGNAFEALIGALYLDKGYEKTFSILSNKLFSKYIDFDKIASENLNFKSQLLELAHQRKLKLVFKLEEETIREGQPYFTMSVYVDENKLASASAFSKRKAEKEAAKVALEAIDN